MRKIVIFCALTLSACASNQVIDSQIENAAQKQAKESTLTPQQMITRARAQLAKASKAELTFYTPLHFKEAQQTLERIENLQKQQAVKEQAEHDLLIITEAFKAEKIINKAFSIQQIITSTLENSLAHKAVLEDLGSDREYPSTYNNIVEDLVDLFKLIEQNEVEKARNEQADVLVDMTALEVKTLIKRHVAPAINILDKAEDNDADDYAEITYEQAEKVIRRAKSFITDNYRDRQGVKDVGIEAVVAANRALTIGSESQSMMDLDEEEAEQKALEFERLLAQVANSLGVKEVTGLSFREQALEMVEFATQKGMQFNKTVSEQEMTPAAGQTIPQSRLIFETETETETETVQLGTPQSVEAE
ncbi:hypothetical protein RS130_14765 [Paraglaciecola aquimarina]|uniref:Lipoprotein n=1 Tax=Paraglaciecola aquimarina TaxID=1235557 RepID=A0ABU3SYA3_9ALTE|nr:hypothetical protein [Paraglaciecola aquimarina]MDU0354997.1 hypothetical protein [Paraglaciecola aquimarina]